MNRDEDMLDTEVYFELCPQGVHSCRVVVRIRNDLGISRVYSRLTPIRAPSLFFCCVPEVGQSAHPLAGGCADLGAV